MSIIVSADNKLALNMLSGLPLIRCQPIRRAFLLIARPRGALPDGKLVVCTTSTISFMRRFDVPHTAAAARQTSQHVFQRNTFDNTKVNSPTGRSWRRASSHQHAVVKLSPKRLNVQLHNIFVFSTEQWCAFYYSSVKLKLKCKWFWVKKEKKNCRGVH